MKKPIIYICICLFILLGALLYFTSPGILLGSKVVGESIKGQDTGKSDIQKYLTDEYPELLKVDEFSLDGESSNRYLVATVTDSDNSDLYRIYYDLKKELVVYDGYAMEQSNLSIPSSFTPKVKNKGDEMRFYENLRYVYEKELKSAQVQQKTDKARRIEAVYESISVKLGNLYNERDAVLYQD